MSDGETMERLWSYLRRYARMTKEMRPSHRIYVLTGALVYYGIKTKAKLGILAHLFYLVLSMLCMYIASLLCVRLERALKAKLSPCINCFPDLL